MNPKSVIVIQWDRIETPSEAELRKRLREEGLTPYAWSNEAGDVYDTHVNPYHKVIYVVRGTITFGLPDEDRQVVLEAGDRLELPTGTKHNALVGSQGVLCLEAQR